ncbi:hypothetical protein FOG50_01689 [Hanseniaspora uvarum]|nr:hypothetical protein FOG50_01689 [Hanseniaspora uvarum]
MSEQDKIIDCPSCLKKIPITKVNSHLDTCLSGTQNSLKNVLSGRVKKPIGIARRTMSTVVPTTKASKGSLFTRSMTLDGMPKVKIQPQTQFENKFDDIKDEIMLSDNENVDIVKSEDEQQEKMIYETKFDDPDYLDKIQSLPLYERLKPQCLKTYIGQDHLLNKKTGIIYKHLSSTPSTIPNMILFGPPSIGKTSLITVLLNELNTRSTGKWKIYSLSGVSLSIPDLKKIIDQTVKSFQNWKIKTSEDVGILNNQALIFANTTYESCMKLGMPESDVILAHCCVLLCESPKSVKIYRAMNKIKTALDENDIYRDGDVPYHLRNAPTKLMEQLGYKKDYKYNPDYINGNIPEGQDYFPDKFYEENLSNEDEQYLEYMKHVYDNEKHLG